MEPILNKKILALLLCLSTLFSSFFTVSEVFAQQQTPQEQVPSILNTSSGYTGPNSWDDGFISPTLQQSPSVLTGSGSGTTPDYSQGGQPMTNQEVNQFWSNAPSAVLISLQQTPSNNSSTYPYATLPEVDSSVFEGPEADEYYKTTQAGQYVAGDGKKVIGGGKSSTGNFASCAIGQQLGAQVSAAISKNAQAITKKIAEEFAATNLTSKIKVPVLDDAVRRQGVAQNEKLSELKAKEVGSNFFGLKLPSLDSIAYCLINTIIIHISESTIRWINTGFKGNPAFIENFDQFFSDLADREVVKFLTEIGNSDFLCGDLRIGVQRNLIGAHNGSRYYSNDGKNVSGYGACSFGKKSSGSQTVTNPDGTITITSSSGSGSGYSEADRAAYAEGDLTTVKKGGWDAYYDLIQPENNIYGASIQAKHLAQDKVNSRAESARTEVITINNGNLSAKDRDGNIYTPGSVIQQQLHKTLDIPSDRLVIADEFDEIMTVLVEQLIKIALDKTVGKVNRTLAEVQSDINSKRRELLQQ